MAKALWPKTMREFATFLIPIAFMRFIKPSLTHTKAENCFLVIE